MQQVFVKIAVSMLMSLLTETFLSRSIVLCLRRVAMKTTNDLDNELVNEIAKALNCNDLVIEG